MIRRREDAMVKIVHAAVIVVAGTFTALAQNAGAPPAGGNIVISADVVKDLAPTGKVRAAINLGNSVLAQKDAASGEIRGVTPELAQELGRRIDRPVELITFEAAGKVFEALKTNTWDIAFLAIEPARATEIDFTAPYVLIEGTYMVPKDSPLKVIADVDRPGVRIAVGLASAYDLYLTRTIKNATLVRAHTGGGSAMIELFLKDKLEAVAGVKQPLVEYAKTDPSMRVMDGRFQEIQQAMGTPKGREAGARYLRGFVEEMKASGFVADALRRSKQADAAVAPPATN
jgi:polar amino acid transport system substrate-binding protein